ncbi:transposase family protein [Streptomyces sp. NPDC006602]|uniref:transposase family protein n=1 Tax=Streptomyces sp. NPDC006602 TaxID=3364751 RepID=UPI0036757C6E
MAGTDLCGGAVASARGTGEVLVGRCRPLVRLLEPDDPAIITGYKATKNRPVTAAQKQVNKLIAAERAVCEHAFAHLKRWRILTTSGLTFATRPRWSRR